MKESNDKIEDRAISALENALLDCSRLHPYIKKDDKYPIWDGEVCLYKDSRINNEDLLGRVSIQIKGKKTSTIARSKFTYSAKVSDLRNYLKDGGVIYFVVGIDGNNKTKIFYETLTCVKLLIYLENVADGQKHCSIELKEFPSDVDRITNVFYNFNEDAKKQSSFNKKEMVFSMDEVRHKKGFEGFCISTSDTRRLEDFSIKNQLRAFHENEWFVYAKIDGIQVPLKDKFTNFYLKGEIKQPVRVKETTYFDSFEVFPNYNSTKIVIGGTLVLTFYDNGNHINFNYTTPKHLSIHLKGLQFCNALLKESEFWLGDKHCLLDSLNVPVSELQSELFRIEKLKQFLDILHIQDDIDASALTAEDWRQLRILIPAIVDGEYVKDLKIGGKDADGINIRVAIGSLNISLFSYRITDNKYEVKDFFNTENLRACLTREEERYYCPIHGILTQNDFETLSNINYDKIVPDYKEAYNQHYPEIGIMANNTLNYVLLAYDTKKDKRLLDTALSLCKWLENIPIEGISNNAKQLDRLQIIKRERCFSEEEKNELYEIVDSDEAIVDDKISAYLLLGEQAHAERLFNKFSKEAQQLYKQEPIYHFWKE